MANLEHIQDGGQSQRSRRRPSILLGRTEEEYGAFDSRGLLSVCSQTALHEDGCKAAAVDQRLRVSVDAGSVLCLELLIQRIEHLHHNSNPF